MASDVIDVDPVEVRAASSAFALRPDEAALLRPDHPFLRFGTWRAFSVPRTDGSPARVVASIDQRQRSPRGAVGCLGFMHLRTGIDRGARHRGEPGRVLDAALAWLRGHDVAVVRAPVQFSTWYGHRAMTDGFPAEGGAPAFAMEPANDRALVELLRGRGFEPAHRAVSVAVGSAAVIASGDPIIARLERLGWHDRAIRREALDEELQLLHRLAGEIFRDSWAASELSRDEFAALYRPAAQAIDPELVRILMAGDDEPIGFAFALPAHSGSGGSAFVLKTIGVLPGARRRHPGAGVALAALAHRAAVARGFEQGIHALMTAGSAAHRTSLRWGAPIRTYATFERML